MRSMAEDVTRAGVGDFTDSESVSASYLRDQVGRIDACATHRGTVPIEFGGRKRDAGGDDVADARSGNTINLKQ